jgi:hypothetical protein
MTPDHPTRHRGEDAEPSDQEKTWWTLLRRAFGIPDIVSPRHQEAAIKQALLERVPPPEGPTHHGNMEIELVKARDADAAAVVQTVAQMGAAGDLDELFVAIKLYRPDGAAIAKRVTQAARIQTPGLVEEVLKVVGDHVRRQPWDH